MRQTDAPLALGSFAAETRRQTNGRASYRGAARFHLRLRTEGSFQICASARGARPILFFAAHACLLRRLFQYPARGKFLQTFLRLLAAAVFYFTIRHAASFFKLFYACLLRRTIKVQAPLTSYSPTAEMQKQSPAAKGSSPRFHLKCPPPARTSSTSSPSVNSL